VEHNEKGLKVIAVGGEKLARGLTLEGLCVSYFVRTTKMYDTLMQMGRWFGYRPGYLDLCRLYTTAELVKWFGHIADASEELREEFDQMAAAGATPWEYGLKVESHPVLLVTSPLKMRTAKTLSLSYSGSLCQTISYIGDVASQQANMNATKALLLELGEPEIRGPIRKRGAFEDTWKRSVLWNGVGAKEVLEFLRAYRTPPGADRANSAVIAEFIEQMNGVGELSEWTIAVVAEGRKGTTAYEFSPSVSIDSFPARGKPDAGQRYTIGVLTDPVDEAIDMDEAEWLAALEATQAEWKPDPARNRNERPTTPSGRKIREQRGKGFAGGPAPSRKALLLLYPLSPVVDKKQVIKGWDAPIMGFAISFPASDSGVKVDYKVDHLLWKEWEGEYGAAD
jgi:hypothetical protein